MTPRLDVPLLPLAGLVTALAGGWALPAQAGEYPYPVVVERESPPLLDLQSAAMPSVQSGTQPRQGIDTPVAGTRARPLDAVPAQPLAIRPATGPVPDSGIVFESGGQAASDADVVRSISLAVSDEVANLTYESDGDRLGVDDARMQGSFLLSERRDVIFSGTLLLDTRPDLVPRVRLSAGARAYVALLGVENRDVVAFGLGVQGGYTLPVKVLPLELNASAFYAPDVLAFGQADRIIDWNVDVGLQLRDQLSAFAGLRFLQVDTRPGSREVEDEIHVGIRWALDSAPAEPIRIAPVRREPVQREPAEFK